MEPHWIVIDPVNQKIFILQLKILSQFQNG